MKQILILVSTLLVSSVTFSQVGIGTVSPQATLEVTGKPSVTTIVDGVIFPRLTRAELTNKGNSLYGINQKGTLIYITDISGGDNAGSRVNITTTGYYFFDGSNWQKVMTGDGKNIYNTDDKLTANRIVNLDGKKLSFANSTGIASVDQFSIDSSTFSVDAVNNMIGIGISNPGAQLDVRTQLANVTVARIGNTGQNITIGVSALSNGPFITTPTGTNNSLRLGVNNSEHLRIDASSASTVGNVGIGVGNATINNALQINRLGSNDVFTQFTNGQVGTTATDGLKIGVSSTGAASIQNLEATSLSLHTNATERMTILSNGNIGIGNTNPSTKLHISGTDWASSTISLNSSNTSDGQQISFKGNSRNWNIGSWNSGTNNFFIYDETAGIARMIIDPSGNIGIGTVSPTTKLEINSSSSPALRLVDGTQAAGKVLSSDANGNASWVTNVAITPTVLGVLPATTISSCTTLGQRYYTGAYITLPTGKWVVNIGSTISTGGSTISLDGQLWCHAFLSNSNSTFSITPDLISSTGSAAAGSVSRGMQFGMLTGVLLINNNSGASKTYYLWVDNDNVGASITQRWQNPFSNSVWERWFYASPIN